MVSRVKSPSLQSSLSRVFDTPLNSVFNPAQPHLDKVNDSYSDYVVSYQGTDHCWLRGGWLKEFGKGPIAVWLTETGKVQMKIFVPTHDEARCEDLASVATHIFAYSGHAYVLDWEQQLFTLQDVLAVAPSLYRFLDVSIDLCTGLEETTLAPNPRHKHVPSTQKHELPLMSSLHILLHNVWLSRVK